MLVTGRVPMVAPTECYENWPLSQLGVACSVAPNSSRDLNGMGFRPHKHKTGFQARGARQYVIAVQECASIPNWRNAELK